MDLELVIQIQFGDLVQAGVDARIEVLDVNDLLPRIVEELEKVVMKLVNFVDCVRLVLALEDEACTALEADSFGRKRFAAVFASPCRRQMMDGPCLPTGSVVRYTQSDMSSR